MIFFFRQYYGLVINLHEIDHTGPYGIGYQRNGNYLCIVSEHGQNNYKRLVPDSKTGLKITLVYYHLTISKMAMTVSVGHVSDLPLFPFNMLLKRNHQ